MTEELETTEKQTLISSADIALPVGIPSPDGSFVKHVTIDVWRNADTQLLTDKRSKGTGIGVLKLLCRRLIQNVPGIVESKQDPTTLIRESLVNKMYLADALVIVATALYMSGTETRPVEYACTACGKKQGVDVGWDELEVKPHFGGPHAIAFELKDGVQVRMGGGKSELHKKGVYRYPTVEQAIRAEKLLSSRGELAMYSAYAKECIAEFGPHGSLSDRQIKMLSKSDSELLLSNEIWDNLPGLDTVVFDNCMECDEENAANFDLSSYFLSPKQRKRKRSKA